MKKNKKGFTLIEIIVCLVIISVIATISIVALVNKKDSDEKIISTVKNAADVYLSTNKNLLEKLNNNYGCKVFSIEEIRSIGLLKNNIIKKSENKDISLIKGNTNSEGLIENDYSNVLICYDDYSNSINGLLDIYYPFNEKNDEVLSKILYIKESNYGDSVNDISSEENFNKYFKDYLIKWNKRYDIENFKDEDYEYYKNFENDESKEIINNNTIYQSYCNKNDKNECFSRVIYLVEYNPVIVVGNDKLENRWYNSNDVDKKITLKNELDDGSIVEFDEEGKKIGNFEIENNSEVSDVNKTSEGGKSLKFNINGNYYNVLEDQDSREITGNIKIDVTSPEIEDTKYDTLNNKIEMSVKDSVSGIDKDNIEITKNGENISKDNVSCDNVERCKVTFGFTDNAVYDVNIKDNAGNNLVHSVDTSNAPNIKVQPIDDSFSKIKILFNNYEENSEYKIKLEELKIGDTKYNISNVDVSGTITRNILNQGLVIDLYEKYLSEINYSCNSSKKMLDNLDVIVKIKINGNVVNLSIPIKQHTIYENSSQNYETGFYTSELVAISNDNKNIIYSEHVKYQGGYTVSYEKAFVRDINNVDFKKFFSESVSITTCDAHTSGKCDSPQHELYSYGLKDDIFNFSDYNYNSHRSGKRYANLTNYDYNINSSSLIQKSRTSNKNSSFISVAASKFVEVGSGVKFDSSNNFYQFIDSVFDGNNSCGSADRRNRYSFSNNSLVKEKKFKTGEYSYIFYKSDVSRKEIQYEKILIYRNKPICTGDICVSE